MKYQRISGRYEIAGDERVFKLSSKKKPGSQKRDRRAEVEEVAGGALISVAIIALFAMLFTGALILCALC